MGETLRVPMPRRHHGGWIGDDDVNVSVTAAPRIGRRVVTMDVDETVLRQIGAHAMEACVEQMGEQAAYVHQQEIQVAVDAVLRNHDWVRPIIEDELRRATRAFVLSLFGDK